MLRIDCMLTAKIRGMGGPVRSSFSKDSINTAKSLLARLAFQTFCDTMNHCIFDVQADWYASNAMFQ